MAGVEVPRRQAGVGHLVVAGCIKADGVSGHRLRAELRSHAGDGGTVGTAAQEAGRWRVVKLTCDGLLQQQVKFSFEERERGLGVGCEVGPPVGCHRELAFFHHHTVACRHPEHVFVNGAWRRDHMKIQVIKNSLRVKLGWLVRERVSAAGKVQATVLNPVAQGLNAKAVNGQEAAAVW